MDLSFYSRKNILITGATGGLGSALVRIIAKSAGKLIVTATSAGSLDELVATMPSEVAVIPIAADFSQPGEAQRLAEESIEAVGHIDIVFNNAGLGYFSLMEEAAEEKIRYLFEVNTFSPLALITSLLPHMMTRGSGRIVNIVSCAGRVPIPTVGVYGGSKSALAVMTNTMRLELEPKGIDIINIYPGTVADSFERNALRESNRTGLCPTDDCGASGPEIAEKVVAAATGSSGEVWLEKTGKWMALAAIACPGLVDNRLKPLRNKAISETDRNKPLQFRRWRLWQIETSLACNLNCVMCPWEGVRKNHSGRALMSQETWNSLIPYLNEVKSIDFTGGGESLLHKNLISWLVQAKSAGCQAGFLTNGLLLNKSVAEKLIDTGVDWLGFSVDGADKKTYEKIRLGANFEKLCHNIKTLSEMRVDKRPLLLINFVIMNNNFHQLDDIVKLAASLGVDQINFKQCDVIRDRYGKGFGLFASNDSKQIKQLQKSLARASRLARKLNITTNSFSFLPEEQPVCDQDPRDSVFIRFDGSVAPCINLAIGGASTFLGKDIVFPTVHYGRLPEDDLLNLWQADECKFYRQSFEQRAIAYDRALAAFDHGKSIQKLKEAFKAATKAMPEAPTGCSTCHYLYDI